MSTINSALPIPFLRDVEVCPYSETCRYAKVCVYESKKERSAVTVRQIQGVALSVSQAMFGAAMFVVGVALSLTLILLPLGLPLALLGVAFMGASGEVANRTA
jgi:hypothetical protein